MTGNPAPPPRIHVIPATGCDKALVLRRGPSMQVASCMWDRKHGKVELGQWLKSRIYEHRCDLSPDAQHMIIFARHGDKNWTAISHAPWLTAVGYYPQAGTWGGGGAFTPDGKVIFNTPFVNPAMPGRLVAAAPDACASHTDGLHMGGTYPAMMRARGWRDDSETPRDTRLSKELPRGWTLHLRLGVGVRSASKIPEPIYTLQRKDQVIETHDWEWAEPWGKGIQFAAKGALWFVPFTKAGLGEAEMIYDFNGMEFENREAPYRGIKR